MPPPPPGNPSPPGAALPGMEGDDDDPRPARLAQYHRLVRSELPTAARAGGWVLRLDHCFARVILDALFGGCWYDHLERRGGRSAERQLDAGQLARAIALAREVLDAGGGGDARLRVLNARSLAWRGKAR